MLDEVLESVKNTERQAQELIAAAETEANVAMREQQAKTEANWAECKRQVKARRAETLARAEMQADAAATDIAKQYADQCAALHESGLAQVDGLVNDLMEIIFNGNC